MSAPRVLSRLALVVAAVTFGGGALLGACSSSNDNPQPNQNYQVEASTTLPDAPTGSTGDDASEDATPDVQEEPIVREDVVSCTLDQVTAPGDPSTKPTCWNCTPQIPSDFYNHCATPGVTCQPFDNSVLPGYDGGALSLQN